MIKMHAELHHQICNTTQAIIIKQARYKYSHLVRLSRVVPCLLGHLFYPAKNIDLIQRQDEVTGMYFALLQR